MRNMIITEMKNKLGPMRQKFGAPIPADYVRAAINALDSLSNFPGGKLAVSPATPQPDPVFFHNLCGQIRCVYLNLLKAGIAATKQDVESVFPILQQQGLIGP